MNDIVQGLKNVTFSFSFLLQLNKTTKLTLGEGALKRLVSAEAHLTHFTLTDLLQQLTFN